ASLASKSTWPGGACVVVHAYKSSPIFLSPFCRCSCPEGRGVRPDGSEPPPSGEVASTLPRDDKREGKDGLGGAFAPAVFEMPAILATSAPCVDVLRRKAALTGLGLGSPASTWSTRFPRR